MYEYRDDAKVGRLREMSKTGIKLRGLLVLLIIGYLLISGCARKLEAPVPTPFPTPTLSPPTDTTPPPQIAGLLAVNAYDGRINLWWDKSSAEDFDHYNVYTLQSKITDVSGITPVHRINDISITNYQITGLKDGTNYYFAITAVDKNGNENKQVTTVSAVSTPMPRGKVDPELHVDVCQPDKVWAGTTLLPDNHNLQRPRIIEVNMLGEIIWEYIVPENLRLVPDMGLNPGFDVELLSNNNILFVSPGRGIYEIDRKGNIIWQYSTAKISHDADRLPNGNTIFVFGDEDQKSDAQVTEINPKGEVVWNWYARDHFDKSPYKDIYDQGWTHTNAVTRLTNGNTLISLRNFKSVVEVDPQGAVVRIIGEGILGSVHDPQILANGNLLATIVRAGEIGKAPCVRAVEIELQTGEIVWQFEAAPRWTLPPVRDANRLPNGNTLVTGSSAIVETSPQGGIVWVLKLQGVTLTRGEESARGFYKAERIGANR